MCLNSKPQLPRLPFCLQDVSETRLERLERAPGILPATLNHTGKMNCCEAEEEEM